MATVLEVTGTWQRDYCVFRERGPSKFEPNTKHLKLFELDLLYLLLRVVVVK